MQGVQCRAKRFGAVSFWGAGLRALKNQSNWCAVTLPRSLRQDFRAVDGLGETFAFENLFYSRVRCPVFGIATAYTGLVFNGFSVWGLGHGTLASLVMSETRETMALNP